MRNLFDERPELKQLLDDTNPLGRIIIPSLVTTRIRDFLKTADLQPKVS